jgi:uncharacterized protein DUF6893
MSKGMIAGLAALLGIGGLVAVQAPEIRRYLKIRKM